MKLKYVREEENCNMNAGKVRGAQGKTTQHADSTKVREATYGTIYRASNDKAAWSEDKVKGAADTK